MTGEAHYTHFSLKLCVVKYVTHPKGKAAQRAEENAVIAWSRLMETTLTKPVYSVKRGVKLYVYDY